MKNIEKLKDIKNANECVGNRCDNSNNWEPNRGTEDDNRSSINNNMNIRIFKYWQEIVATWLLISVWNRNPLVSVQNIWTERFQG